LPRSLRTLFIRLHASFAVNHITSSTVTPCLVLKKSLPRRPLLTLKTRPVSLRVPGIADATEELIGASIIPGRTATPQAEPVRAMCFFDGQNLHKSAEQAFGCDRPVDPLGLAQTVCAGQGWRCDQVRFYQGDPDPKRQPVESQSWSTRRAQLRSDGVVVFDRRVQYIDQKHQLADGTWRSTVKIKEKGIDLRMGLDIFALAQNGAFDVAVLFCRDQDLRELIPSIAQVARTQNRPISLVSAFPKSNAHSLRGIDGMRWLPIDQGTYEAHLA
jgi:uncharacterized LabA/DUF88 family protein